MPFAIAITVIGFIGFVWPHSTDKIQEKTWRTQNVTAIPVEVVLTTDTVKGAPHETMDK